MSVDPAITQAAVPRHGFVAATRLDEGETDVTAGQGLILVIVGALVFFATWWNRYLPPTSGGEAVVMAPWAHDYLPYRDYFMQAPPGVPILVGLIQAIAGPHVLATLTFGALLRIGGACALYRLLLRVARPSYAAVATLTGLLVSSTDISDTPFYYNHLGAGLLLIGSYLAFAGANGSRVRHHLAVISGGVLLTFAIAIKQTMLFGTAAAFVALVLLVWPRPRAGWIPWLLGLVAGGLMTVGALWAWLAAHDLVNSFFFIMRRAPEGKGGVARSLFRPLTLLFDVPEALAASVAAWILIAIVAAMWILHRRGTPVRRYLVLLFVVLATVLSVREGYWSERFATLFLTAVGWWGSLALAAVHLGSRHPGRLDPVGRAHIALGILSFGIGYSFAVSWPLFENIAFPGLALVMAAMLERPPSAFRRQWAVALLVLAVASMAIAVDRKFTSPHSWGLWYEPPLYETRRRFEHPALAGMRISEASWGLYDLVSRIAHERTLPDDRIYVFPNMPILYAIADRRPATYSLAHWVDICPDFLGREDADRLRANPPKMMIIRDDSMDFVANEERLYRGGEQSSVRDVVKAFNDMAPMYERVAVFESGSSRPVIILVRRNPSG